MKKEAANSAESPVTIYRSTHRHIPKTCIVKTALFKNSFINVLSSHIYCRYKYVKPDIGTVFLLHIPWLEALLLCGTSYVLLDCSFDQSWFDKQYIEMAFLLYGTSCVSSNRNSERSAIHIRYISTASLQSVFSYDSWRYYDARNYSHTRNSETVSRPYVTSYVSLACLYGRNLCRTSCKDTVSHLYVWTNVSSS